MTLEFTPENADRPAWSIRTCRDCGARVGKSVHRCEPCRRQRVIARTMMQPNRVARRQGKTCACGGRRKYNSTQCQACANKRTLVPCPRCSTPFWPWEKGKHPRKFCSQACIAAPKQPRARKPPRAARVAQCEWCSAPFNTTVSTQKFCCDSHQAVAKSQRRKALMRKAGNNLPSIGALHRRDRGICQRCGGQVSLRFKWPDGRTASRDHIVPLSLGGRDEPHNVQLAHLRCNLKKHVKLCGSQLRLL